MEEQQKLATTTVNQPPAKQAKAPRGLERPIDQEDLIFPYAKLLQPGSPEVTSQEAGKAPTNWAGQLIDSLDKSVLPMEFIPVFYKKKWVRFNAMKEGEPGWDSRFKPSDVMWKSEDALDPRVIAESKFAEDGTPPLATAFLSFFAFFPGHPTPAILSFSRSSYKAGKNLLNMALRSKKDVFATKYRIAIKKNDGPNNSVYFSLNVEPVGPASAEEFAECERLYDLYANKEIKVDESERVDETGSGAQPGGEGPRPY
jgi:hypothetical protein